MGYSSPGQATPGQSERHDKMSHLRARARAAYQAYRQPGMTRRTACCLG